MSPRTSLITVATTVAVLASGASVASATTRAGATTAPPATVHATTAVAIQAFPTGGQGSGSEATCAAYTRLLQRDELAIKYTEGIAQQASQVLLDDDVDAAMDAGCAVVF